MQHFLDEQTVVRGFFRGRTVRYLDLGAVKLAPGNTVAPIWVVTNGTAAQQNIIDVVPGRDGYTPLWRVTMVTWKRGSAADAEVGGRGERCRSGRQGHAQAHRDRRQLPGARLRPATDARLLQRPDGRLPRSRPHKLRPGNTVAPIWAVTNGTGDQRNVIDVVPGDEGYTPLWGVRTVTWKDGVRLAPCVRPRRSKPRSLRVT